MGLESSECDETRNVEKPTLVGLGRPCLGLILKTAGALDGFQDSRSMCV